MPQRPRIRLRLCCPASRNPPRPGARTSRRREGVVSAPAIVPAGSIYALAGCNGAGKSSIGGQAFRHAGIEFFNPDEAAGRIAAANGHLRPLLTQAEINGAAWDQGRRLLERAIREHANFAFETTLGGRTMTDLLQKAARNGLEVHVWFAGLATVDMHIDRVRRRVAKGGHDIPLDKIRERFDKGRPHLIRLLPELAGLHLYDNSSEADPDAGNAPEPRLLMRCRLGRIVEPADLKTLLEGTPAWAKSIFAAALKLHMAGGRAGGRSEQPA